MCLIEQLWYFYSRSDKNQRSVSNSKEFLFLATKWKRRREEKCRATCVAKDACGLDEGWGWMRQSLLGPDGSVRAGLWSIPLNCFELNIEFNLCWAWFNVWLNNQNVSNRASWGWMRLNLLGPYGSVRAGLWSMEGTVGTIWVSFLHPCGCVPYIWCHHTGEEYGGTIFICCDIAGTIWVSFLHP